MTARESFGTGKVLSLWREAVVWAMIAAYLALVIRFAWNPTSFAQILAVIGFVGAVTHSTFTCGWKSTLVLLTICLVITFTMEIIGSITGFPFGHYHFEVGSQFPHIGVIAVIVGGVWFGAGYLAWIVAAILLDGADQSLRKHLNVIALPFVAAFVLTQWDFVMDAPESTISRAWIMA